VFIRIPTLVRNPGLPLISRLAESLQVGLGRTGGAPAGQGDGEGRGLHDDDEGYAGGPFAQRPGNEQNRAYNCLGFPRFCE
jgi:hypothetical protein